MVRSIGIDYTLNRGTKEVLVSSRLAVLAAAVALWYVEPVGAFIGYVMGMITGVILSGVQLLRQ